MKYRALGRSSLRVSELCLGAMTFGEESGFGAPEPACREIYNSFLDAGGNFIDTANIYTQGTSETMLGRFMAEHRERLVIASKFSMNTSPADPNAGGNHRKNLVQAVESSLRRLNTDYIDLYWMHGWDQVTPLGEVMRALDDLVRAGKILHIGVSNAPAWYVTAANTLAEERNMTPFTAFQVHYNLVERGIEADYFDVAAMQNMAILAWSPLAAGLLSGKFNTDAQSADLSDTRLHNSPWGAKFLVEERLNIARGLAEVAAEAGASSAQVALAWLLQRPQQSVIPILGARNMEQFSDNMACLNVSLSAEQIARLDALNEPQLAYPHTLLANEFYKTMVHGAHWAQLTGTPQDEQE